MDVSERNTNWLCHLLTRPLSEVFTLSAPKQAQKPKPKPQREFLCHRCTYPLGDLPRTGNCPECGASIFETWSHEQFLNGNLPCPQCGEERGSLDDGTPACRRCGWQDTETDESATDTS